VAPAQNASDPRNAYTQGMLLSPFGRESTCEGPWYSTAISSPAENCRAAASPTRKLPRCSSPVSAFWNLYETVQSAGRLRRPFASWILVTRAVASFAPMAYCSSEHDLKPDTRNKPKPANPKRTSARRELPIGWTEHECAHARSSVIKRHFVRDREFESPIRDYSLTKFRPSPKSRLPVTRTGQSPLCALMPLREAFSRQGAKHAKRVSGSGAAKSQYARVAKMPPASRAPNSRPSQIANVYRRNDLRRRILSEFGHLFLSARLPYD
jgi:hypothetical protein